MKKKLIKDDVHIDLAKTHNSENFLQQTEIRAYAMMQ